MRHAGLSAFVRMTAASWRAGDRVITLVLLFPPELFDHVTEKEITLKNTGKVGFEFKVLTDHQSSPDNLLPGVPLILPLSVRHLPTRDGRVILVGGVQSQPY